MFASARRSAHPAILAPMTQLIPLAIGAAFFPVLIAAAVVILTRPHPARLLLAFWLGGLTMSMVAGMIVLSAFHGSQSVAGTTKDGTISPEIYLLTGILALLAAALIGTHRGRELLGRRPRRRRAPKPETTPWAERVLERGTLPVAAGVGAALNLPGPFYLIALGIIADHHESVVADVVMVLGFNLVMFVLIEVPLVGYLVRPAKTAALVHAMSGWLHRNGVRIATAMVGLVGVFGVAKGLTGLIG